MIWYSFNKAEGLQLSNRNNNFDDLFFRYKRKKKKESNQLLYIWKVSTHNGQQINIKDPLILHLM